MSEEEEEDPTFVPSQHNGFEEEMSEDDSGDDIEDDSEAVAQNEAHNIDGVETTITIANTITDENDTITDEIDPITDETIDPYQAVMY